MPLRYEQSATEGLVRVTATGRVELQDVIDHMKRARQAGACRLPGLLDLTRVEAVGLTVPQLLAFAQVARGALADAAPEKRAILVGSSRHFLWARIFAGLVSGWMTVGVFTERRDALLWLTHRAGQAGASGATTDRRVASG